MALCKQPRFQKNARGLVPCGECRLCRVNLARKWTFRIMMEARLSVATWWTTLTYSPEMQPDHYLDPNTGEVFEHPQGCLRPDHIELFIKRVRKEIFPQKLRYYLVGEYGDLNARPHYHICIFGHGEEIQRVLEKHWNDPISKISLGFVDRKKCRPLDTPTARYTVGYTIKKLTKKNNFRLEGRYPEFSSHSQGIGAEFAKRFADALRNESGANHILTCLDIPRTVRFDGKDWPLDRYLRGKILEHLGLTDFLLQEGEIRFQKEMRSLSARASLNPKLLASRDITPRMLEQQYLSENAQKILNTETRINLTMKEKPL